MLRIVFVVNLWKRPLIISGYFYKMAKLVLGVLGLLFIGSRYPTKFMGPNAKL